VGQSNWRRARAVGERRAAARAAAVGEFGALALLLGGDLGEVGGLLFGGEQGADDVHDARGVEHVDDAGRVFGRDLHGGVRGLVVAPPMSSGT
jgi:hypothetical protein